jgi:hypothetical protein
MDEEAEDALSNRVGGAVCEAADGREQRVQKFIEGVRLRIHTARRVGGSVRSGGAGGAGASERSGGYGRRWRGGGGAVDSLACPALWRSACVLRLPYLRVLLARK